MPLEGHPLSGEPTLLSPVPGPELPGVSSLVDEMDRRWGEGQRLLVEDLLLRHPDLASHPGAALRLICEEYHLRRLHGPPPDRADFYRRFPQWQDQLEELLDRAPDLDRAGADGALGLRPGDSLGPFALLAVLGRGAVGCVFLARQGDLADRPVVVKVVPADRGEEHLCLARLQHTHIVPLYSLFHDADRELLGLVMPYFGGVTLGRLVDELRPVPLAERTGRHVLAVLDRAEAAAPVPSLARGAARAFLSRASYAQVVAWVGACLADALDHAHQHGLVHLDIKPSNVLLATDGEPMLLDFHLARPPLAAGEPAPAGLGGTLAYMPREQQAALAAVRQRRPLPAALDGQTDLFGLGATLYAALGGQVPVPPGDVRPLETINPQVSPGLSDVVGRCLEKEASRRYPDAAALAADLRRYLTDQPLTGVPNRSARERWQKWRRRRPQGLALLVMGLAVVSAAVAVGLGSLGSLAEQRRRAAAALAEGQTDLDEGRPDRALGRFRDGLAEGLPFDGELADQLRQAVARAETARTATEDARSVAELRDLADRLRLLPTAESPPPADLAALEPRCAALWERRLRLAELPAVARPDLLDLAVLGADLHVRVAPQGQAAARRRALAMLDEAEALFPESHILESHIFYRERERYARDLGLAAEADLASRRAAARPPQTAWEYHALGLDWLRRSGDGVLGQVPRAAADLALRQAVALKPHEPWPNFHLGQSAYANGRLHDAVAAFSVCIGAAPRLAAAYHNRALAHAALGDEPLALADVKRACDLDPTLTTRSAAVWYNLAVVALTRNDAEAARRHLDRALAADRSHSAGRALQERLRGTSP